MDAQQLKQQIQQATALFQSGRYDEAAPMEVTLSGTAFGQPVSFSYDLALADSNRRKRTRRPRDHSEPFRLLYLLKMESWSKDCIDLNETYG